MIVIDRPVSTLKRWLDEAQIKEGPAFRRIDQWGNVNRRALTPQSVNLILKNRCKQVGLDPASFSAHGLRSGYLTEAANRGIPLPEAMQQSLHKSVTQAARYYNDAERKQGCRSVDDMIALLSADSDRRIRRLASSLTTF
ncbi:hypothetical protein BLJAPNOD_05381 [Ensifer sp. M14]|uniref:Recombinase XerD n=1 Tax=Sinorhizobium sp. M14 TaxID=430451 RepID=A0A142BP65_9HYPH|nr:recombinase XerD [Sinorhizobium sp. M14]RDL47660.1 hypothetical protein BLJAPNOD_05381 [Ensifer sp. M14]